MGTEAAKTADSQTKAERVKIVGFLLISAVILLAEVLFMDYCILKLPELIQVIYDKVTLPSPLLFVTHLKGLFQTVMMILVCAPAILLMVLSGFGMSKIAGSGKI